MRYEKEKGCEVDTRMGIIGIGTDIVEIARIRKALNVSGDRLISRLCTWQEALYIKDKKDPAISLAACFAGKEAVLKALGTGLSDGICLHDIEILHDAKGAPHVRLHGCAAAIAGEGAELKISLSHSNMNAIAFTILFK